MAASSDSHERPTTEQSYPGGEEIPFFQKVFDRPLLLLAAGLVVMFGFYTIWGIIEIFSLPQAPLP